MSNLRRDYKVYLLDIHSSSRKIIRYTKSKTSISFANDQKTIDAVIRNFEIIGEATSKIPAKIRKDLDLPWMKMIGLRNKAIHEYFDVNVSIIWKTAKDDIPMLEKLVRKTLKELGSNQLKLK